MIRRRLLALLALGGTAVVGGCGKKGPLRLPEPPSSAAPSSTSESADEEPK
jgi:predicted small lipoprotein YifL